MKSFLKIFNKKGKDKWQYGDNTTERANSDTNETFHENESDKTRAAWSPAAATSYLTILEAIYHKIGQLPLSNISSGFEAVKLVEAFLSSQVDKKFVETFDANVLFSAAMQILEVTEALLWERNSDALLKVARISAPTIGKYDGEILSSIAPHSLQVLGGLLAFSEIMTRCNPSNGFTLADKLAVRLLPHFSNRQNDLQDSFSYLMGNYREYFPFGQQFVTRLVGASSAPEEVTVQEWLQYSKRKTENTDSPSAHESPSFSGVRDSTKVILNRVDSSVDFANKPTTLSVPESMGDVFNPPSARLVGGIAAGGHSTDEAESKGVEYKDTVPNDEGIQYFRSDSDLSDTDSKSFRNKKLAPAPQPQSNYTGNRASYHESNDFDDDSIEDIGMIDIKGDSMRPVIAQEKSKLPDDSILSIPELEEPTNRHEKESLNSWDEEEDEEEEQPVKQTQHVPPPIFSPPMLAKTSNANKWKTEKMYTFDESESDEGAADAEAKNASHDINDIPSLSDNIGDEFASSIVVEVPEVKHTPSVRDSKLFVLTTLDISRDSESAYDKECNSFVNRTFSVDEPEPNHMKNRQSGAQTESKSAISNSQDTIDSGTNGNKQNVQVNPVNRRTSEPSAQAMAKVHFEDGVGGDQPPLEHKDVEKAPNLETANVQVPKVPSPVEKYSRHELPERVIVNQAGSEKGIAKNILSPPTQLLHEPSENRTLRNSEDLLRQSNTLTGEDETDSVRSDGSVVKKKKKGIFGFMNKIKKTFSSSRDRTNSSKDAPLSESTSSLVVNSGRESLDVGIAMREASQDKVIDQSLQMPADETAPNNNAVAEKSFSSSPVATHQQQQLPIPEQNNVGTDVCTGQVQSRGDDEGITLLVHDETEKSIHELFDHLKRRNSFASMSSFDSNLSSRSLDHANKKVDKHKRLSNPALKSKSVFGTFKNVFRLSSSNKGNTVQGKEAVEPSNNSTVANNALEEVAVTDLPGARLSSSGVASNNNAEEKSDYGDEIQSMVSSMDSRSVNTATLVNKFTSNNTNYPKNGIGLAKILRRTNRIEESVDQKTPPLVAPITASDAFASALLKVDRLAEVMNDIERTREELQLVSGPQSKVRAEVLRDDIARVQRNRLQKLNSTAPVSDRSEVLALDAMDESTIRKMFNELRNGSSSSSVASTVNIDDGLNYISTLSITSVKVGEKKAVKKENKDSTGVVMAHDIATIVLEPLFGVFTTGIPLPKHIANALYTARQMSKIAEDFPSDNVEINCPFQMASESEIACGIHFSGELVKRLPRGNFRRRYFILVVSPNGNPNLTVDSFGTRAAISTTKDETIREVAKKKYNSKLPRDYYLMEYSSCTISKWGKIPIGWKRCYPLRNLMSVHTKTDTQSKGTDFKLIFQAKPRGTTPMTRKDDATPALSTEQLQLDKYKDVLQKNVEAGKIESERMRVLEVERKKNMPPPPEAVQLQSYMNVLRKNVSQDKGDMSNSSNLTVAAEGAAPIVEGSGEDQDGSAENKSGSGDSFEKELYHEFSDIATSLNDGISGSYIDEGDQIEVDEDEDVDEDDQEDEDDEANNSIDNLPGENVAQKDQQAALLNAQREIHKILSQPINRKRNKEIVSLALRAPFPDSRMKWVAAIQAAARNEIYLNTLNY